MIDWIQVRGTIGVHCGSHGREPAPRGAPRPRAPAREGGGTGEARVHEREAHSGLLRTPPPSRESSESGSGHFV